MLQRRPLRSKKPRSFAQKVKLDCPFIMKEFAHRLPFPLFSLEQYIEINESLISTQRKDSLK